MPRSNDPLVPRDTRRHAAPLAPQSPLRPLAPPSPLRPQSQTQVPSARPSGRRSWPWVLRVFVGIATVILIVFAILAGLVLAGQTTLVAWIIVGAVLVVVFGTPLLCLVGLFAFNIWALTRLGRSRRRPAPTHASSAKQTARTIVAGEVVIDD